MPSILPEVVPAKQRSQKRTLKPTLSTQTVSNESFSCLPLNETGRLKFFGTMDRQEVAKVAKLMTRTQMLIGNLRLQDTGAGTMVKSASLLTIIAEISVHSQISLDYLTAILCNSKLSTEQCNSLLGRLSLLLLEIRATLGLAELMRTSNSSSEELNTSN